ncbi:MAG: hypothetical protein RIT45_2538 [Pseudomonadota bacterium]|jgi:hypothetical protein
MARFRSILPLLFACLLGLGVGACGADAAGDAGSQVASDGGGIGGDGNSVADGSSDGIGLGADVSATAAGFPDRVVAFEPGANAGFGAAGMPGVVLGPPKGGGAGAGGLHVVSLGKGGVIVLAFDDEEIYDGPGADLVVFENPFSTWLETGRVSVSADGTSWHPFPCAADDAAGGYPGCAGVQPVFSHPDNGLSPHDPAVAGGDAYDLADLGLSAVRFVRIEDTGANSYVGNSGGFDLDAVAAVHWR